MKFAQKSTPIQIVNITIKAISRWYLQRSAFHRTHVNTCEHILLLRIAKITFLK